MISGLACLFDEADAGLVATARWRVDSEGYVAGTLNGNRVRIHRVISGAKRGQIVDHRNRSRRDNRRANLRLTDRRGNARNSGHRRHNKSGYRGVYLCNCTGRWRAEIRVNGRGIKLGRFDDPTAAARAYDVAAQQLHGEFAVLNFHNWQQGGPYMKERIPTLPAEKQGLFRKFTIERVDGSSEPGGKHEGCRYFVLDMDCDPHAVPALSAYADACEATHPALAADLRAWAHLENRGEE